VAGEKKEKERGTKEKKLSPNVWVTRSNPQKTTERGIDKIQYRQKVRVKLPAADLKNGSQGVPP